MRRAILFRYHTRPDICLHRIALLRRLNPGVAIYGMYGGALASPMPLPFDHNYVLPFSSPRFKWQNGDLCARQWFLDCGHRFAFDMLHIVEWDLVFLQPLDTLFRHIRDGVAITHIKSIRALRAMGWYWISTPRRDADLESLRRFMREKYGKTFDDRRQLAGLFPGASMSRAFLEHYAGTEPFARPFLNDQIRTVLFAQAFGMRVHETGFYKNNPYFDCGKRRFLRAGADLSKYRVLHHMRDKIS